MYAGQLVEVAPVAEIFRSPRHPYTQALLAALPTQQQEPGSLRVIPGRVPNLVDAAAGVPVLDALPVRDGRVRDRAAARARDDEHLIACWLSEATKRAADRRPRPPQGGAA